MSVEVRADHRQSTPEAIEKGSQTSLTNLVEFNPTFLPLRTQRWVERRQRENPLPEHILNSPTNLLLAFRLWDIAFHEEAHAQAVTELGGKVKKKSVIPEGNSEGRTIFTPPDISITKTSDVIALYIFYVAAAAASEYGEEMAGNHDHSGCGGDRGMIKAFCTHGEKITRGLWKASEIEQEGRRQSRLALACVPLSVMEKRADKLADELELAA